MQFVKRDPNRAYLDNWLWVPKSLINVEGTKSALQFTFEDKHSGGLRTEYLWRESEHHLLVPRETWQVGQLPYTIVDCRPREFPEVDVTHNIQLDHKQEQFPDGTRMIVPTGRNVQRKAVEALIDSPGGILQLACGLGKTVVALYLAAMWKRPTLIIVDTTQLVIQWRKEIEWALNVPGGVGHIQSEVFDWQKSVVIATYQTLAARSDTFPEEVRRWFGTIIWDEGHHIGAPTFAKAAPLFYGRRIALTATPERDDGMHVIYEYHIGPVRYKNLSQDLKPTVYFRWTGLNLTNVPANEVTDVNGMLHLMKLGTFYGKWITRMRDVILEDVKDAAKQGRKILVLSNSIDEAVNLLTIWTRGWPTQLYTDIPEPSPHEVGETLSPLFMDPKERKKTQVKLKKAKEKYDEVCKRLRSQQLNVVAKDKLQTQKGQLELLVSNCEQVLKQDKVGKKILKEYRRRQKKFREDLLADTTDGGLMIYKVSPEERNHYLATRQVVFAIAKYGKEALNSLELDTVLVSMPFSSRNSLQQLLGRPSREFSLKLDPRIVIYEDEVGIVGKMCRTLRQHLREWSLEDNGPYEYELIGYPHMRGKAWTKNKVFGQ